MPRLSSAKSGQAMIEALLAVLIVTSVFLVLFKLSYLLTGKILLEHAAMRVARARSVGFNDFMCRKTARVAVIPVAGERTWPTDEDAIDSSMELARVPIYMSTGSGAIARGVLDYEGWDRLGVTPGNGTESRTSLGIELFDGLFGFTVRGKAGVEENASLYLEDSGL